LQHGYTPRYGDTDSVFLEGPTSREQLRAFEQACKEKLGVPAKYERTFTKLLLVSAKNYIGEHFDEKTGKKLPPMIKGLVGKKSSTAKWARKTFDQVVKQWLDDRKNGMFVAVTDAVYSLKNDREKKNVLKEDLLISTRCGQDPFKGYKGNSQRNLPQKILGMKHNKKEGEAVEYYLADNDRSEFDGAAFTEIFENLSIEKYLERLETAVLRVLHAAGFTVEDIYDALELKVPPRGELRDKLWGKPKKADDEEDDDDEADEEDQDDEEEKEDKEKNDGE
jgi:DNA polymerase elongation subunit (family B)